LIHPCSAIKGVGIVEGFELSLNLLKPKLFEKNFILLKKKIEIEIQQNLKNNLICSKKINLFKDINIKFK
jgi:hypothetical protein